MNKVKIASVIMLVSIALFERLVFDLGPNFELVTVATLLTAMYFGGVYSIATVLLVMTLSDLVLGNTNIFIFTWSGFLIPALVFSLVFTKSGSSFSRLVQGSIAGIGTSLFFYLWTNFGVWALGSMYPHNTHGLVQSFVMGLPFLKLNMISTLILVPVGFTLFEVCCHIFSKLKVSLSSTSPSSQHRGSLPEKE